jgi:negative regulator of genetic competence, sporulation and motility
VINLELTLIDKEKLEIFLTQKDMDSFNISAKGLDYKTTETRRAVWTILDKAKHETGFDAASGKIRIDALTSRDGGCVIFITKTQSCTNTEENMSCPKEKCLAVPPKPKKAIYGFTTLSDLLRACRFLRSRGYSGESTAFMEKEETHSKSRYYLSLSRTSPPQSKSSYAVFENMFITEFGTKLSEEHTFSYMSEHCDCFCEQNAVNILSEMV